MDGGQARSRRQHRQPGPGESIVVAGGWRSHARHGWQFAVERVRICEPVSDTAVKACLQSVKHIGPLAAARSWTASVLTR